MSTATPACTNHDHPNGRWEKESDVGKASCEVEGAAKALHSPQGHGKQNELPVTRQVDEKTRTSQENKTRTDFQARKQLRPTGFILHNTHTDILYKLMTRS